MLRRLVSHTRSLVHYASVMDSAVLPRRPIKRRRIDGLNSRFDEMIKTVNVLAQPPPADLCPRRKRMASSSSAVSIDPPATPVDAYNDLGKSRLGRDFSVLKMNGPSDLTARSLQYSDVFGKGWLDNDQANGQSVPTWLCDMVSGLGQAHPLRVLLPSDDAPQSVLENNATQFGAREPEIAPDVQPIFAFNPYEQPQIRDEQEEFIQSGTFSMMDSMGNYMEDIPSEGLINDIAHDSSTLADDRSSGIGKAAVQHHSDDDASTLIEAYIQPYPPKDFVPFSTPGPDPGTYAIDTNAASDADFHVSTHHQEPVDMPSVNLLDSASLLPFSEPGPLLFAPSYLHSVNSSNQLLAPESPTGEYELHANGFLLSPVKLNPKRAHQPAFTVDLPHPVMGYGDDSIYAGLPLGLELSRDTLSPSPVFQRSSVRCTPPIHEPQTEPEASPFRFYFDAPLEDPVSSDPLDEADYMLPLDYGAVDIEALDFKWEKFDRGHASPPSPALPQREEANGQVSSRPAVSPPSPSPDIAAAPSSDSALASFCSRVVEADSPVRSDEEYWKHFDEFLDEADEFKLPAEPKAPPPELELGPLRENGDGVLDMQCGTPAPRRPGLPFAPAPGIFILPLRGSSDPYDQLEYEIEQEHGGNEAQIRHEADCELAMQEVSPMM